MPAKDGVADAASLDHYTAQTVHSLTSGYRAFAGQREDGFYGDIQGMFDLLSLRAANTESPGANRFDSQSGFNCHTLALEIPVSALGGNMQVAGVYATTSREKIRILSDGEMSPDPRHSRGFTQVGRQGNPLFCEALVAIKDKDLYNRTQPSSDATLFQQYTLSVELEVLIEALLGVDSKVPDAEESNRTDIASFFIPDLIKVDLSTGPCRLPGGNADDAGYSRLGLFGVDRLVSQVQTGLQALAAQLGLGDGVNLIPGGWPNGRRFGDDVIDIAVSAILSDLRDPVNATLDVSAGGSEPAEIVIIDGIDNVSGNDSVYNRVFPYAGTPHNGRNYQSNAGFTNTSTPPPAE